MSPQKPIRPKPSQPATGSKAGSAKVFVTKGPPVMVRLQKVLAEAGIASRRHSEEIILAGRVKIDGVVCMELGVKVNPHVQKIFVDDELIHSERKVYYLVNKPVGFLSTNDDPAGRQRVIDLLPRTKERLYPVGRLDEASQGLMLVTNDGPLANRLLHPRYGVPKTYRVQVAGTPDWKSLESLHLGQEFSEGTFKVDSFKLLREQGDSTFLEIVLKEGHNREIRRLFARIGHKVLKLERVAFGPLRIAKLGVGDFRHLTTFEIRQLKQVAAGLKVTGEMPAAEHAARQRKSFQKRSPHKPDRPVADRTRSEESAPRQEPVADQKRSFPKRAPGKPAKFDAARANTKKEKPAGKHADEAPAAKPTKKPTYKITKRSPGKPRS